MKPITWDEKKNKELKKKGRPSFEEVLMAIDQGGLIDQIKNHSQNHPEQEVLVVNIEGYIHAVPVVETENAFIAKTIFPSRKLNEKYGGHNG